MRTSLVGKIAVVVQSEGIDAQETVLRRQVLGDRHVVPRYGVMKPEPV